MVSQDDDMSVETENTELLSEDESEEEEELRPIRRSPRLNQKVHFAHTRPASISQAALTSFIGNSFMKELEDIGELAKELGLEHVANEVVHPVTKETITNYKTLIKDPIMREIWMEAMAKELASPKYGGQQRRPTRSSSCPTKRAREYPRGKS